MIKKKLIVALSVVTLIGLTACGNKTEGSSATSTTTSTTTEVVAESQSTQEQSTQSTDTETESVDTETQPTESAEPSVADNMKVYVLANDIVPLDKELLIGNGYREQEVNDSNFDKMTLLTLFLDYSKSSDTLQGYTLYDTKNTLVKNADSDKLCYTEIASFRQSDNKVAVIRLALLGEVPLDSVGLVYEYRNSDERFTLTDFTQAETTTFEEVADKLYTTPYYDDNIKQGDIRKINGTWCYTEVKFDSYANPYLDDDLISRQVDSKYYTNRILIRVFPLEGYSKSLFTDDDVKVESINKNGYTVVKEWDTYFNSELGYQIAEATLCVEGNLVEDEDKEFAEYYRSTKITISDETFDIGIYWDR